MAKITIEMDDELIRDFQNVCEHFSMTTDELFSTLAEMTVADEWGVEAAIFVPNEESLEALRECEDMRLHPEKYPKYNSVEELVASIHAEMAAEDAAAAKVKDEGESNAEIYSRDICAIPA